MHYLFSKKNISSIFIILIILWAIWLVFTGYDSSKSVKYEAAYQENTESLQANLSGNLFNNDSDNWEKLVNNLNLEKVSVNEEKDNNIEISESLTQDLTQKLLDLYMQMKIRNTGTPLTSSEKELLIRGLSRQTFESYYKNINPYTKESFKQVSISKEFRKTYINHLSHILITQFQFKKASGDELPNELDIFMNSISENNYENLSKLNPYINAYENSSDMFKELTVPEVYASIHLNIINSFYNIAYALRSMKDFSNDPIKGALGLNLYKDMVIGSKAVLFELKSLIKKDEFIFDKKENGYILYSYLENEN